MAKVPTVDAVAWVRVERGRVLAVRTSGKDAFYLPGGKREHGESEVEALRREVKEEVAVELRSGSVVAIGRFLAPAHDYPAGTLVDLACFTADFEGVIRASGEIEEVAWLGPEDEARCAPAVRLVIGALHQKGEL